MPNPILAPEYWVDKAILESAKVLEQIGHGAIWRLIEMYGEDGHDDAQLDAQLDLARGLKLAARALRDNRLEIIASITKPGGE